MHRRLVAIGRAAAAYGKFQAARDSLEAAGQWAELMPLCALQGDFDALRDYAARVSGSQVPPQRLLVTRSCPSVSCKGTLMLFEIELPWSLAHRYHLSAFCQHAHAPVLTALCSDFDAL